ncbi:MAG: hypothetical protein DRJ42_08555 [Deltaproteobacteria bacterium]|nr:MAG: hypothetical protein DRJ42_08555 [Deltaproteobacteria bacterium]
MGSRFDINGSIWLSDLLDSRAESREDSRDLPSPSAADVDRMLDVALPFRDRVTARIRAVRRLTQRRYANPFGGASPLPGAPSTLAALTRSGARPKATKKSAALAARALSGAHTARFERALKSARAELVFLRDDVGPELHHLGPEATELEAIDGALSRALLVRSRELTDSLFDKMESAFEATFVDRVFALPPGPADDPDVIAAVEAWYGPDGWVPAHVGDTEALALALYDRDAELITQLVDAACELAAATGNA